jgi:hypothetical protein
VLRVQRLEPGTSIIGSWYDAHLTETLDREGNMGEKAENEPQYKEEEERLESEEKGQWEDSLGKRQK